MRVIVVGMGEVGRNVAQSLIDDGQEVILIDQDAERVQALEGTLDAQLFLGNGASPRFLKEIGAKDADLLLAVTQNDEANIISALAAKQLGVPKTVARIRDPDYFESSESYAQDVLGIDFVINPERTAAEEILEAIMLPGAANAEYFSDSQLAMAEIIISLHSPLVNRPLKERQFKLPHNIVGVIRGERVSYYTGEEILQQGDRILVTAKTRDIAPLSVYFAGDARKVEEVMIFGGGRIGWALAEQLEDSKIPVKILEHDAKRARILAEHLPHAEVFHEEGVSKEDLLSAGLDEGTAFVACAGDDRANLLACLRAKQLGAGITLSVVSREDYAPLVQELGLHASFSPRVITASAILRFLRKDHVKSLHLLVSGSEFLEMYAQDGSKICNRTVRDAGLGGQCVIGNIIRDGEIITPSPEEVIQEGDDVLLFVLSGHVREVEKAFES